MADRTTAVVARSHSYTGTTWLNCLLSSHPDAFFLGAPERIWRLACSDAEHACLIHGAGCDFWPAFLRRPTQSGNFLLDVADAANVSVVVLNNPSPEFTEACLRDDRVDRRWIMLSRDGRAVLTSLLRHHPGEYTSVYDAIQRWLDPADTAIDAWAAESREPLLWARYEELANDPTAALARIGAFIGLAYPRSAVNWWTTTHHMTSGNTGVVDLVRREAGRPASWYPRRRYYDEVFRAHRAHNRVSIIDESWRTLFTRDERFLFDYVCGSRHARLGYERDEFSKEEAAVLRRRYGLPVDAADRPRRIRDEDRRSLRRRFTTDARSRTVVWLRSVARRAFRRLLSR